MHHRVEHRTKKTENITIYRIATRNFLKHKKETYNTQGNDGNRTRCPTLCRGIEPGMLITRPRKPYYPYSFFFSFSFFFPNVLKFIILEFFVRLFLIKIYFPLPVYYQLIAKFVFFFCPNLQVFFFFSSLTP